MKPASTRCTLFRPFNLFKQMVNSSRDSNAADCHVEGGCKYLIIINNFSGDIISSI